MMNKTPEVINENEIESLDETTEETKEEETTQEDFEPTPEEKEPQSSK